VARHLAAVGLPTRIGDIPGAERPGVDQLLALMAQDKKVRAGRMTFILARGIGEAFITRDVDIVDLKDFLSAETAAP
jgi:3-dehydroquinate synthetase